MDGYTREPRIWIWNRTLYDERLRRPVTLFRLKADNDFDEEWFHYYETEDRATIERLLLKVRAAKLTPEHLDRSPHWSKLMTEPYPERDDETYDDY